MNNPYEETAETLRDFLRREGYVRCDSPACACGSYHGRFGLHERWQKVKDALAEADHPLTNANGNTVLRALGELVADRDRLRVAQVNRRKLEAEALSGEIRNRETEAALAALPAQLAGLVAAVPGLSPEQQSGVAGGLGALVRPPMAGQGNYTPQGGAEAFSKLLAAVGAFGGEDQRRGARILEGGQLNEDFAGTTQRADAVAARNAGAVQTRDVAVEGVRQRGAYAREQLQETGRDRRAKAVLDARGGGRGTGGRTGQPLDVNEKDIDQLGAVVDDIADSINPGEKGFRSDPRWPNMRAEIVRRASAYYQDSRNQMDASQRAFNEVLDAYAAPPGKPAAAPAAPAAAPAASPSIPPQAVARLKEGTVTTFKNGQRWTLRNGQPVQVQ